MNNIITTISRGRQGYHITIKNIILIIDSQNRLRKILRKSVITGDVALYASIEYADKFCDLVTLFKIYERQGNSIEYKCMRFTYNHKGQLICYRDHKDNIWHKRWVASFPYPTFLEKINELRDYANSKLSYSKVQLSIKHIPKEQLMCLSQ